MLSGNILKKLNAQITREHYAANLYLQMSAWCFSEGYEGCARFLRKHSEEEKNHMQKLYDYVNETGGLAEIGEISAPPSKFDSISDVFHKTYEHEKYITKEINSLVTAALDEKDYSSFNFLQWYVSEQHEEEFLFKSILDKIKIITEGGDHLFFVDQEIGRIADN